MKLVNDNVLDVESVLSDPRVFMPDNASHLLKNNYLSYEHKSRVMKTARAPKVTASDSNL